MDWIKDAAEKRNADRQRQNIIARGAPTLWDNICRATEQAVNYYSQLPDSFPVEFSGRANHTISVSVFENNHSAESSIEREKLTITFNQQNPSVEVRSSRNDTLQVFPMTLNSSQHVCLTFEKREISVETFTKMALRDAFFPA